MSVGETLKPFYKKVGNLVIPGGFNLDNFASALTYEAQDDDLFVVSFPKCGSTWTQHIIYLILHNGVPVAKDQKLSDFIPFLENVGKERVSSKEERPRVIKTHLPYEMIPKNKNAKYVYIARNAKDALVSFFHHTKNFHDIYFYADGKFDDYFEIFLNGENDYGDYFDYTRSLYEHRHEPNVLFLTYEGMKQDPKASILSIARFMGKNYEDLLLQNNGILENVIKHSDASEMKNGDNRWYSTKRSEPFVRKGIVGDWRAHFSEEQSRRMNDRIKEKFGESDILNIWPAEILY